MEVRDAVEGVVADIEDEPVPPPVDALGAGHRLRGREHLGQHGAVRVGHLVGVGDVLLRDDQHVGRGGRVDVAERVRALGLENLRGRHLAGDDLAEQAVAHAATVVSTVRPVSDSGEVSEPADGPNGPVPDIDALLAELSRWTGDQIASEAARARVKERWLRQQQLEEARFSGVAEDLVELGASVTVRTTNGRTHTGELVGNGRDFVVLRPREGLALFVAIRCVASLRPPPGHGSREAAGARQPAGRSTLAAVITALAADRPRVHVVVTGGGEALAGDLRAVGADVVTLRLDDEAHTNLYVRLGAIDELTVLG